MADEVTSGAENNIDTLRINIDVSTEDSKEQIDSFYDSVEKIQPLLTRMGNSMAKFEKSLGDLNVAKLKELASAAEKFGSLSISASSPSIRQKMTKEQLEIWRGPKEDISIQDYRDPNIKASPIGITPPDDDEIVTWTETEAAMHKTGKTTEQIQAEIDKIIQSSEKASNEFEKWDEHLGSAYSKAKLISTSTDLKTGKETQTYQYKEFGGSTTTYKVVDGYIEKIDKKTAEAVNSAKKFNNIWSSVGHVLKYRAILTAINLISNGLNEGIKNVALFDSKFNETISNIITKSNTLSNQIGASAAELVTSLAPLVNQVLGFFTYITDGLTQLFALLNGEKEYNKAVDNAYDFAKSLKKAYSGIGIDELNILSTSNEGQDANKMFEKTKISGWDIAGSVAGIAAIATSFLTIKNAINGVKMGKDFLSLISTIKGNDISKVTKMTSAIGKGISALALLGASFVTSKKAGEEFANAVAGTGNGSVTTGLLSLVGGVAAGAGAGALIGGPIGAVIGGLGALVTAAVSWQKAARKIAQDKAISEFFGNYGVSIGVAKDQLGAFYESIVKSDLSDYYNQLNDLTTQYIDSAEKFDKTYKIYSEREELTTEDIDNLTSAFHELADAATELNNFKIDTFTNTLQTAIGMIPTEKIEGMEALFSSVSQAIKDMNANISSAQEEFNALIQDGIQEGELEWISELAKEINENALTDEKINLYSSFASLREGVNLGSSKEEIETNVEKLKSQAQEYIYQSQLKFDEWLKTAAALYEMGKISSEAYDAYKLAASEGQKNIAAEINEKLAEVLDASMQSYVNQWVKKIEDETGDLLTSQELIEDIEKYATGFLQLRAGGAYKGLSLTYAAGGLYEAKGVADMYSYLLEEYADWIGISEKQAWEQQKQDSIVAEEHYSIVEGNLDRILYAIEKLYDKDNTVIIGDDVIGNANDRYQRNRGRTMNGEYANAY